MSWLIVGIFYLLVKIGIYLKIALTQFKKAKFLHIFSFELTKEKIVIFKTTPRARGFAAIRAVFLAARSFRAHRL